MREFVPAVQSSQVPERGCGYMDMLESMNRAIDYIEEPCPEGFEEITIPACTWAIFEAVGSLRPIPNALQDITKRIFSKWLPNSGYQHAMVPEIEYYPVGDMTDPKYKYEVWIPIVK